MSIALVTTLRFSLYKPNPQEMASTSLNLFSSYFANKLRTSYTTVNLPGDAGNGNFFTKISRVSADREISAAWTCTKL